MSIQNPERRKILGGALGIVSTLLLVRSIGAETAAHKISKAQAKYQEQPKAAQRCANCMHFIAASNSCKLVEGKISPNAWCTLWANKLT